MYFDLTYFRSWQKSKNDLVRFMDQMRTRKSESEIYWPLQSCYWYNRKKADVKGYWRLIVCNWSFSFFSVGFLWVFSAHDHTTCGNDTATYQFAYATLIILNFIMDIWICFKICVVLYWAFLSDEWLIYLFGYIVWVSKTCINFKKNWQKNTFWKTF